MSCPSNTSVLILVPGHFEAARQYCARTQLRPRMSIEVGVPRNGRVQVHKGAKWIFTAFWEKRLQIIYDEFHKEYLMNYQS